MFREICGVTFRIRSTYTMFDEAAYKLNFSILSFPHFLENLKVDIDRLKEWKLPHEIYKTQFWMDELILYIVFRRIYVRQFSETRRRII